ncbi:hypothetical protein GCM10027346_29520 [Hymenobacter seoulensis]
MKINFRFLHIIPILLMLVTDPAFTEFVVEDPDSPLIIQFVLGVTAFSMLLTALFYRRLSKVMRRWLFVVVAAIGALVLESYNEWGTYLVYPHVFNKLLVLLLIFAAYAYYRRYPLPVSSLMVLLLLGLLINIAVYHPDALSLSAFLDNERGFNVTSAYLLLLPALYYFNQYLNKGGLLRLALFFTILAFIVFLQHRTVWLTAAFALAVNILLLVLGRVEGVRLSTHRILPIFLMPLIVGLLGGAAVVIDNPQVLRKLEKSVSDIENADKQGTGSWRLKQFQSYQSYVEEYPVLGMRLEGFELPVQFYGDDNAPIWPDRTGHHFHSFYLDRLFYFGIVGLLLVLAVPIVQLWKRIRQPTLMSPVTVAFICFTISSLLYGVSYDWPTYLYGLVGLTLALAYPLVVPSAAPALHWNTTPPDAPNPLSYPTAPGLPSRVGQPAPEAPNAAYATVS